MTPGSTARHRKARPRTADASTFAGPRPGNAPPAAPARTTLFWALAGALTLLPLLWASRGPTLGVAFADDYIFLLSLASGRPLDLFGPMGAPYLGWYWRPVSRQLYFLLMGPWLLRAPWVATLFAAVSLVALYALLYRVARRFLPPLEAAALACFPLLAEPARVLLTWPSAAQHLLGALFAALAVERAAAGSLLPSAAAALLALLSNEAAFVVLPALPLVGGLRSRSWRGALPWGLAALAVAALWAAGYAVARRHGTGFPAGAGAGLRLPAYLTALVQALVAQMNWEDLTPAWKGPLQALSGLLIAAGVLCSFTRAARRRLAGAAPVLLGGLAWFLAAVLPLTFLQPDWSSWRSTVAALGLAVALGGWLALAARPLVAALVALRLAALLLTPSAPAVVSAVPEPTASSFSFAHIVRLQRLVHSTHQAMMMHVPRLPRGGTVRYWGLPQLAEIGFADGCPLRVWYGDSTLVWTAFGGDAGFSAPRSAMIEFNSERPWPATFIEPRAMEFYAAAWQSLARGNASAAESLATESRRAQSSEAPGFTGLLELTRARAAFIRDEVDRADSLAEVCLRTRGPCPGYWAMIAYIAAYRGDLARAYAATRECLAMDPGNQDVRRLARVLREPGVAAGLYRQNLGLPAARAPRP